MGSYNRIKASKNFPIGTIMPWCGSSRRGSEPDRVPAGWIVCNQANTQLFAADYPILAKIIGNTYGPIPEAADQITGVNFGIVNDYPYNPPDTSENHDPEKHVDVFSLPNLNQIALVDIEGSRISTTDLLVVGKYISANGSDEGKQSLTLYRSDVDIQFDLEPSNTLAGKITGITMSDPVYFDTIYVLPRKLGIDHTPNHNHQPASADEFDQFITAVPSGSSVLEFQPGIALKNDASKTTAVTPIGRKGTSSSAHTFKPGTAEITWYDPNDGGISLIITDQKVTIPSSLNLIPQIQSRVIPEQFAIENSYTDDGSAIVNIQADAHTGAFPPAGYYQGKRNYYKSPDIPSPQRGSDMPTSLIADTTYDPATEKQPINTSVTNTFPTTLNHSNEEWGSTGLKSHDHDSMELTMERGGLGITTTLLVNNVSTGTTSPVSIETALSVAINPNTPSLTMIYIMRAF